MTATRFLVVAVIPALLGRCGRVHAAGAVSFWQIALYSVRAIAHIVGVVQRPCGKPCRRSICHKPPLCWFPPQAELRRSRAGGLASSGAAVGQLWTGTHQQEKVGLIL